MGSPKSVKGGGGVKSRRSVKYGTSLHERENEANFASPVNARPELEVLRADEQRCIDVDQPSGAVRGKYSDLVERTGALIFFRCLFVFVALGAAIPPCQVNLGEWLRLPRLCRALSRARF